MSITINGSTGISGVDGDATTPAIRGADSDTGISFGTNEVKINTNGNARVTVDSSGNVGIGVASPSFPLQLVKAAGGNLVNFTNNTDADFQINCTSGVATAGPSVGALALKTNNSERARITTDGYLRLVSQGIQFNNDTAAANSLDDYEEGSWIPTLNAVTVVTSDGNYTKIGNICICVGSVQWPTTSNTSQASLLSLPFTAIGGGRVGSGFTRYTDTPAGYKASYHVSANTTNCDFYNNDTGAAINNTFFSNRRLDFVLVYTTA